MRPSTLCALVRVLGLSAAAVAAAGPQAASSQSAAPARAASSLQVQLQKEAGSVEFFAVGWPSALKIHGKGSGPHGYIQVHPGSLTGSLTFDLDSLETGIALRDRHLKENYLETSRYPQATLTVSQLDASKLPASESFGPVSLPFEGVLSLHGVQKTIGGAAKVTRAGSRVTGTAEFPLELGDFGVDVPKYLGITVAEKVQVKVTFSAHVESRDDVAHR